MFVRIANREDPDLYYLCCLLSICDTGKKIYGKCSKILNAFLFLFSNKMLVFRAGIHKMLVRIANREDPDLTASSEAV